MINKIKGYAKASRHNFTRVMALIMAIAVLCAGTAFAATSETYIVDVYEGSQVTRIETTEKDAYSVVAEAEIQLADNDKLILNDFAAGEDSKIIVCRASNVKFINADGTVKNIVFAGTVAELIEQQGVVLSDKLVSSVNVKAVVTNNLEVEILNYYNLTINVDNEKKFVKSTAKTVGDLLKEQNIVLDSDDEVVPSADTALSNELVIDVLRVEYVTREAEETVKFTSKTKYSSAMLKGTKKVTQEGVNGSKIVVYKDRVVNGVVESSEVQSEKITKKPVDKVTTIGTLVKSSGLGNSKIEKNGKPISELTMPSKYTIGENNIPTNYKYKITGRAAAYCQPGGKTATGKKVMPGRVAVNPKQIPYGTEMWIVSNDGIVYGYAVAEDTGGFAKKGYYTVDLYMNSNSQCRQWGDRGVTIYVL
ncbi:MAG: G5 domain-containing protein [Clostridia bacterium]|nr:G5 domain-containing protein [Clostridia bacterium]